MDARHGRLLGGQHSPNLDVAVLNDVHGDKASVGQYGCAKRVLSSMLSRPALQETNGNFSYLSSGLDDMTETRLPTETSRQRTSRLQMPSLVGQATYGSLNSLASSIPRPLVLASGINDSCHVAPSGLNVRRGNLHLRQKPREQENIFCLNPQFQAYRQRQETCPQQRWPSQLENAFVDSVLLIPQMGRRKFTIHPGKPYGRNQLIGEYMHIAARLDKRGRKEVSSHIQVCKGFFRHTMMYHIFFGTDARTQPGLYKELAPDTNIGKATSFKNHPVLVALSRKSLSPFRPDLSYVSELLLADTKVAMRPEVCWIYLSNSRLQAVGRDGLTRHELGSILSEADFPHRYHFTSGREDWGLRDKEERNIQRKLLHEYTWNIKQAESDCIKAVAKDWAPVFPSLHAALENRMNAQQDAITYIHMHLVLDIHNVIDLPDDSGLDGLIKMSITQPGLQSHRWKVVTCMERPELLCADGDSSLSKFQHEIGAVIQHVRGCNGNGSKCDCINQHRRGDVCTMPFPAHIWAPTLAYMAQYPPYKEQRGTSKAKLRKVFRRNDVSDSECDSDDRTASTGTGRSRARGDDGCKSSRPVYVPDLHYTGPTQRELMQRVAMYQEVFSCPPELQGDAEAWTCRTAVLWTFETTHYLTSKPQKNKPDMSLIWDQDAGASWRFLTVLDPTDAEHQKRMIIEPGEKTAFKANPTISEAADQRSVLSVSRTLQTAAQKRPRKHRATPKAPFGAEWEDSVTLSSHQIEASERIDGARPSTTSSHNHSHARVGSISSLLDFFPNSLPTPPPSATLFPPCARSAFDAGTRNLLHSRAVTSDPVNDINAIDHDPLDISHFASFHRPGLLEHHTKSFHDWAGLSDAQQQQHSLDAHDPQDWSHYDHSTHSSIDDRTDNILGWDGEYSDTDQQTSTSQDYYYSAHDPQLSSITDSDLPINPQLAEIQSQHLDWDWHSAVGSPLFEPDYGINRFREESPGQTQDDHGHGERLWHHLAPDLTREESRDSTSSQSSDVNDYDHAHNFERQQNTVDDWTILQDSDRHSPSLATEDVSTSVMCFNGEDRAKTIDACSHEGGSLVCLIEAADAASAAESVLIPSMVAATSSRKRSRQDVDDGPGTNEEQRRDGVDESGQDTRPTSKRKLSHHPKLEEQQAQ